MRAEQKVSECQIWPAGCTLPTTALLLTYSKFCSFDVQAQVIDRGVSDCHQHRIDWKALQLKTDLTLKVRKMKTTKMDLRKFVNT